MKTARRLTTHKEKNLTAGGYAPFHLRVLAVKFTENYSAWA
jgi:hypothetical protein